MGDLGRFFAAVPEIVNVEVPEGWSTMSEVSAAPTRAVGYVSAGQRSACAASKSARIASAARDDPTTGSSSSAWSAASRDPSNAASATSCWIATSWRSVAVNASGRSSVRSPTIRSPLGDRAHLDRAVGGQRGDEVVVRQDRRRDAFGLAGDRGAQDRPQRLARLPRQERLEVHRRRAMIVSTTSSIMRAHLLLARRGSPSAARARPLRGSTRPRGCRWSRSRRRTRSCR